MEARLEKYTKRGYKYLYLYRKKVESQWLSRDCTALNAEGTSPKKGSNRSVGPSGSCS